jgi:hypothetical protein
VFDDVKRLFVGRPLHSDRMEGTLLPKRVAPAVFCSDPISSVAYATEQILLVLAVGGLAALAATPWVALAVILLLVTRRRVLPADLLRLPDRRRRVRGEPGEPRRGGTDRGGRPVGGLRDDGLRGQYIGAEGDVITRSTGAASALECRTAAHGRARLGQFLPVTCGLVHRVRGGLVGGLPR